MSSLLFILINIFHIILITKENNINCNIEYNECFNCSFCGEETSNYCKCNWDPDSKICKTGIEKSLTSNFYEYFPSCTDDNSKIIIDKYCGKKELELDNDDEIKIYLPENNGIIGTRNLYCEYKYTTLDKKDVFYFIQYETSYPNDINSMYIYLTIIYNDETSTSGYLSQKEIKREFDNIKEVKLSLYFSKGLNSLPFSLTIKKNGDKAKIALYITIGLIILACLLCALIIYCLSKKISENARLRQRTLLELAMARQRGQYSPGEDVASSGGSEADVEEENRKKIEILFKTSLHPKNFIKKYGLKDGNTCTICIEDFKEKKSKVSITTCQHVFHYKCLRNWLFQNVLNPKCPNCNYNLIKDVENKKTEEIQTIEVAKRTTDVANIETQGTIENNNQNLNTNENRFITRNVNRARSRVNNMNRESTNQNMVENGGNTNEIQEVIIENI